jgi:hypothetical protein
MPVAGGLNQGERESTSTVLDELGEGEAGGILEGDG